MPTGGGNLSMLSRNLSRGLLLSTSIVAVVVSYGRRAYADSACVLTGSTYLCSGTSVSEILIEQDDADVRTEAGFSATNSSGNALVITGDGDIRFTDEYGSSITGSQYGLLVKGYGIFGEHAEAITIDTNGDISGTKAAIRAELSGYSPYGPMTITVGGEISGTTGIQAILNKSSTANITVEAGATISAKNGIEAISGDYHYGYGGTITVTVDGDIHSEEAGSVGVNIAQTNNGSAVLTVGAGAEISAVQVGAQISTNWRDATVTVEAGARVSGETALTVGSGYGSIDITVDGDVSAPTGGNLGLYANAGDDRDITISVGSEGRVANETGRAMFLEGARETSVTVAGEVSAGNGNSAMIIQGSEVATLQLQSGYVINGAVVASASDSVYFELGGTDIEDDGGSFNVSLLDDGVDDKEQFQGFESFFKVGSGDWTLTGTTDVVDLWNVNAGRLFVDASMDSTDFVVAADATLGGTGTVRSVSLVSGSHIAPGSWDTPGTLTVDDDLTLVAGSVLDVLAGANAASQLHVNGVATIDAGAIVSVYRADPEADYTGAKTFFILTADDGYTGTFDEEIDSDFAFLDASLAYEDDGVILTLLRNNVDFGELAGTPNQSSVADAITGLEGGNPIYDAISVLSGEEAELAFETLSGNTIASVQGMVIGEAGSFDALLGARTDAVADGADAVLGYTATPVNAAVAATSDAMTAYFNSGFWVRGTGTRGALDGDGNGTGADYGTGGIAAGLDSWVTPNLLAGAAIDYAQMEASFEGAGGTTSVVSTSVALYGRFRAGELTLDGRLGYGVTDTETERMILVGSESYEALGSFGGSRWQAAAEAGYDIALSDRTLLRPVASLGYVRLDEDGFVETGAGDYGLTVDARVTESLQGGLGFELTQRLALGERSDGLALTARARWQHEFLDVGTTFEANFTGSPSATFAVAGATVARDSVVLGLEAAVQASEAMSLYARYDAQLNPDRGNQAVSAGLRANW